MLRMYFFGCVYFLVNREIIFHLFSSAIELSSEISERFGSSQIKLIHSPNFSFMQLGVFLKLIPNIVALAPRKILVSPQEFQVFHHHKYPLVAKLISSALLYQGLHDNFK